MSWSACPDGFCNSPAYKRNRHTQSSWSKYRHYHFPDSKRFSVGRMHGNYYCITSYVVDYEQMVMGFRLSYCYQLVGFYSCGFSCIAYCIDNSKLPGNQFSLRKSWEIVTHRMIN